MTLVERLVQGRVASWVMDVAPVPLSWVRVWLLRDNDLESRKDGWNRLRDASEQARYAAVRELTETYAGVDGFVLDVGCAQGILQEGLRYGRYLGIDAYAESLARAAAKSDATTAFVLADASAFVPDEPPDVVVLNEVLYYLPDPLATALHYGTVVRPGGVLVVSVFARAWSCRRLLSQIGARLELVEQRRIESGTLAWTVTVFRSA